MQRGSGPRRQKKHPTKNRVTLGRQQTAGTVSPTAASGNHRHEPACVTKIVREGVATREAKQTGPEAAGVVAWLNCGDTKNCGDQ